MIKICIDAGHGGKDSGAVNGSRYEKNDTLKMAKRTGKALKANGFKVIYTRTTDTYDTVGEKARLANKSGADLFISIHRNSSVKSSAKGVEVLLSSESELKSTIANDICKRFAKRGFDNRGIKIRTDLTVLIKTNMPALLVEAGFISNKGDNELFDEKHSTLCNDIARAVCSYYDVEFKTLTELGLA